MEHDPINHPSHYNQGPVEVIAIIEQIVDAYKGPDAYNVGCIVKYLARAPYKGDYVENLRKAKWYMDNLLAEYIDIDTNIQFAPPPKEPPPNTKPPHGKVAVVRNGKTFFRKKHNK